MAKAIIYYEKVWYEGKPMIKILNWGNIKNWVELPPEYCSYKFPMFFQGKDGPNFITGKDAIIIVSKSNSHFEYFVIRRGDILEKEDFERIVSIMKQAGERLHNILKRANIIIKRAHKRLKREIWSGKGEIIV